MQSHHFVRKRIKNHQPFDSSSAQTSNKFCGFIESRNSDGSALSIRQAQNKGMTLVEVAVVSVIMLVILIPIMTLFSRSVELTYVGDQESTAQKEVSHGMYLVGQDIQKTLSFVDINTTLNRFSCWIYDSVGTGSTKIGYYRASDSTLRRISNYSGSYSGGEIISRYVSGLNCTFRTDTLYNLTADPTKVAAVFVQIGVKIPGKTFSAFTANSSWWSRNIRTL